MSILALTDTASRAFTRFEWAGLPAGVWALGALALAAALAAGVVFLYRREHSGAAPRLRWAACGLRLVALAALGVILLAPSVSRDTERDVPGRVVILLDRSASMSVRDAQLPADLATQWAAALGLPGPQAVAGLTRQQIARAVLQRHDATLLRALAAANQLDLLTFADDLRPLLSVRRGATSVSTPDWSATGPATDLAGAVRAVLRSGPSEQPFDRLTALSNAEGPLAGIIVLTDGRETAGGDLSAAAEQARARGVHVDVIGIGSPAMPRDVAVTALSAPARAIKGLPVRMEAFVRSQGYAGREVTVVLTAADKSTGRTAEVLRRVVTLAGDGRRQSVDLTHTPADAGDFTYAARIEPLEGEFRTDNNAASTELVVAAEKIGVLIVAGGPSYDYRFLKSLIERDPTFAVSAYLHGQPPADLPSTRERLLGFDVVLLLDPSPEDATADWLKTLAVLSDSEGLGVIYVPGPTYAPALLNDAASAPLRELLPVAADSARSRAMIGAPGFHTESWPVSVEPSALGHPVLSAPAGEDAAAYWRDLPPLYWAFPVGDPKPGATVLMQYGDPSLRTSTGGPTPLVAAQPYGLGRVVYVGSPETWRWRRAGVERYERFWLQAVRHCAGGRLRGGERRISLMPDRSSYAVGDAVRVRARILDEKMQPQSASSVTLTVTRDGSQVTTVRARAVPGSPGVYDAVFYPEGFGRFAVSYTAPDGARASEPFEVREPEVEFADLRLARSEMQQLAETTGGRYVLPDALDSLPATVPDLSRTVVESGPLRPAWDHVWALALLVCALTVEWVLRKRMGLA
jgi:hypothetical protein